LKTRAAVRHRSERSILRCDKVRALKNVHPVFIGHFGVDVTILFGFQRAACAVKPRTNKKSEMLFYDCFIPFSITPP
jgi:hypothetical protein